MEVQTVYGSGRVIAEQTIHGRRELRVAGNGWTRWITANEAWGDYYADGDHGAPDPDHGSPDGQGFGGQWIPDDSQMDMGGGSADDSMSNAIIDLPQALSGGLPGGQQNGLPPTPGMGDPLGGGFMPGGHDQDEFDPGEDDPLGGGHLGFRYVRACSGMVDCPCGGHGNEVEENDFGGMINPGRMGHIQDPDDFRVDSDDPANWPPEDHSKDWNFHPVDHWREKHPRPQHAASADVDDTNSVRLPYNPTPDHPATMGLSDSTIQPGQGIDIDKRLSPSDSLSLDARDTSEAGTWPGPNPDLFAHTGGFMDMIDKLVGGPGPENPNEVPYDWTTDPRFAGGSHKDMSPEEHKRISDMISVASRTDQRMLDSRYASIPVNADHFGDPVTMFRDDPSSYIQRMGHAFSAGGDDLETMQHQAHIDSDPEIKLGAWRDVRSKAMRIRASGGVQVDDISPDRIMANVVGDHGTYKVMIAKGSDYNGNDAFQSYGDQSISNWHCACKWGDWAFKRQHTYIGRLCSHGYAAYLEMQAQHMAENPQHHFVKGPRKHTYAGGHRNAFQLVEAAIDLEIQEDLRKLAYDHADPDNPGFMGDDDPQPHAAEQFVKRHHFHPADEGWDERAARVAWTTNMNDGTWGSDDDSDYESPFDTMMREKEQAQLGLHGVDKARADQEGFDNRHGPGRTADLLRMTPRSMTPDFNFIEPYDRDTHHVDLDDEIEVTGHGGSAYQTERQAPSTAVITSSYSYDQDGPEMGDIRRRIKDLQQRRRNGEDVKAELAQAREDEYSTYERVKHQSSMSGYHQHLGAGPTTKDLAYEYGIHPQDLQNMTANWSFGHDQPLDSFTEAALRKKIESAQYGDPAMGDSDPGVELEHLAARRSIYSDWTGPDGDVGPDLAAQGGSEPGFGAMTPPEPPTLTAMRRVPLHLASDDNLLTQLRDISTTPASDDLGSMQSRNDHVRDVVDELHDRGMDASQIVASVQRMAWGWDDSSRTNPDGSRAVRQDGVNSVLNPDGTPVGVTAPNRVNRPDSPTGGTPVPGGYSFQDMQNAGNSPTSQAVERSMQNNAGPAGAAGGPTNIPGTPGGSAFSNPGNVTPEAAPKIDSAGTAAGGQYEVKAGDTLSDIAKAKGVDLATLEKNNAGAMSSGTNIGQNADLIHPGDKLNLGPSAAPAAAPVGSPASGNGAGPAPGPVTSTPSAAGSTDNGPHGAPGTGRNPTNATPGPGITGQPAAPASAAPGPNPPTSTSTPPAASTPPGGGGMSKNTNPGLDNPPPPKTSAWVPGVGISTEHLGYLGEDADLGNALATGFAGSGPDPQHWSSSSEDYLEAHGPDLQDLTNLDRDEPITRYRTGGYEPEEYISPGRDGDSGPGWEDRLMDKHDQMQRQHNMIDPEAQRQRELLAPWSGMAAGEHGAPGDDQYLGAIMRQANAFDDYADWASAQDGLSQDPDDWKSPSQYATWVEDNDDMGLGGLTDHQKDEIQQHLDYSGNSTREASWMGDNNSPVYDPQYWMRQAGAGDGFFGIGQPAAAQDLNGLAHDTGAAHLQQTIKPQHMKPPKMPALPTSGQPITQMKDLQHALPQHQAAIGYNHFDQGGYARQPRPQGPSITTQAAQTVAGHFANMQFQAAPEYHASTPWDDDPMPLSQHHGSVEVARNPDGSVVATPVAHQGPGARSSFHEAQVVQHSDAFGDTRNVSASDYQASNDASEIVRQFQAANGGPQFMMDSGGGRYDDFSGAASQFMQRTAGRTYSMAEQAALENEMHPGGARNLDQLDLRGTHYLQAPMGM